MNKSLYDVQVFVDDLFENFIFERSNRLAQVVITKRSCVQFLNQYNVSAIKIAQTLRIDRYAVYHYSEPVELYGWHKVLNKEILCQLNREFPSGLEDFLFEERLLNIYRLCSKPVRSSVIIKNNNNRTKAHVYNDIAKLVNNGYLTRLDDSRLLALPMKVFSKVVEMPVDNFHSHFLN